MDHDHWLRGQRLEACRVLLTAYDEYAIAASMLTRVLEREADGPRDVGQAFGRAVSAFRNAYWQVRLVGSPDVREHASRLRTHLEDHKDCTDRWMDDVLSVQGSSAASERAEEERLRIQLGELHDAFMETASRAVSERQAIA
ncbi:hypothetical protein [Streptomyces dysideae]|uniref:Uncharacterized protein n=1 Tax=Streptomyces dysideae TaxID=909626 RepID=A0A117S237_9ACTN|nr:hypothetical protein [Streptomyces dysideae]KUO21364.1 hypothetical protein AQJ91_08395 [Streptomyces dysideae]